MGLTKRVYTDLETVITAENLNEIQDAIIALEDGLFSVDNDKSGEVVTITDAAQRGFRRLSIYGKTTQDGTPTPSAPVDLVSVGDSGSIAMNVNGKNLLPYPYYHTTNTEYGVSFIVNSDGTVHISGTNTEAVNFWFTGYSFRLAKGVTYTLSIGSHLVATQSPSLWIKSKTKGNITYLNMSTQTSNTFTPTEDIDDAIVYIVAGSAGCSFSGYIEPQIEVGSMATSFEPYKSQRQIFNIAHGLHGIPVSSGGNYTDSNGQRWICDTIDFARRVFTKRIGIVILNGLEAWYHQETNKYFYTVIQDREMGSNLLCDSLVANKSLTDSSAVGWWARATDNSLFAVTGLENAGIASTIGELETYLADNPITVQYILAEPIETPIPEEELAAYAALYTYKDYTAVSNDAGAYMELEYVMDAKKYIDSLVASAGIHNATVE